MNGTTPIAPQNYPPPSRGSTDWGRIALYGGGAVAVVAVGYGVYTVLNNITSGPGAGLTVCEQNYKTAFAAYTAQYQYYVKLNGGAPPTQTQEASLNGYVTQMNSALACVQSEANYNSTVVASFLTEVALAAVITAGAVVAFRAYLNSRTGGKVTSGTEARQATRDSIAQTETENGTMSQADGAANVSESRTVAAAEGDAESAALGSTASADLAAAETSGDVSLVDSIQLYTEDLIDSISFYVTEAYDYFVDIVL